MPVNALIRRTRPQKIVVVVVDVAKIEEHREEIVVVLIMFIIPTLLPTLYSICLHRIMPLQLLKSFHQNPIHILRVSSIMFSHWISTVQPIDGSSIKVALHTVRSFVLCYKLEMCQDQMLAANDTSMSVCGTGVAGSISNVLYLLDLQANLYSQKQAKREGASILLSDDGLVFTITTITGFKMEFKFYGTFWVWDDVVFNPSTSSVSDTVPIFLTQLPSQSAFNVAHNGAVHEFLLLHFRMGHLSYQAMLRGL